MDEGTKKTSPLILVIVAIAVGAPSYFPTSLSATIFFPATTVTTYFVPTYVTASGSGSFSFASTWLLGARPPTPALPLRGREWLISPPPKGEG